MARDDPARQPCTYCGTPMVLTRDHIIPKAKVGGRFGIRNIAYACRGCNELKSDMTPNEMRVQAHEMRAVAKRLDEIARRVERLTRDRRLPNPNLVGVMT